MLGVDPNLETSMMRLMKATRSLKISLVLGFCGEPLLTTADMTGVVMIHGLSRCPKPYKPWNGCMIWARHGLRGMSLWSMATARSA